ncbi:DNA helicase PcrA [Abyssisolibacter fermentans]|uniref:DNA helicase PcrA n=1 Tax=Abyssisolibacter fermentans TaxID=1766203 RepID=UPI000837389D|nr:DNA helicase PcrA [Abyssisolibacter fermentans]
MDCLKGLNNKQIEAVTKTEGPVLVLAGAGSGKTRVLTHKIAYLIKEKKVRPSNILALTFTNKAATEMKDRIERLLDMDTRSLWAGTFHSICVRILRRDIERLGYNTNFVIFDSSDQKTVVNNCIKEMNLNPKHYEVKAMISFISNQKNQLISPDKYINDFYSDFRERQKGELYALYQKKLKSNNALDFDDLIIKTIELFSNNEDILSYYQEKFKYILVDEYQDTNGAQYELIRLLGQKNKNVCVVGDADQSIYGWRGADITNILEFEKEYPNTVLIKLEQNYRSTKNILAAANCVIENNLNRKKKDLWTEAEEGKSLCKYNAESEIEEAYFVTDRIQNISDIEGYDFNDFCILYRTNAQSRVLEEALIKRDIPYKIIGGLKFYDRKEIKDIVAYLRLIQNPLDNVSFRRIVNTPKRGIGLKTIEKVQNFCQITGERLYSAILDAEDIPGLSKGVATKLQNFSLLIGKFIAMKEIMGVKELIETIINDIGYIKELQEQQTLEAESRIENIKEFISVAVNYEQKNEEPSLEDFLASISLLSDVDKTDETMQNTVSLMTIHSAKGLEFPIVFMTGMEESVFPLSRAMFEEDELEEERRLCYVGITRAEKQLFLTHTDRRMLYGKSQYNSVSRFINEIPKDLIEEYMGNAAKMRKTKRENMQKKENKLFRGHIYKPQPLQPVNTVSNSTKLCVGTKVKHSSWGIGTVVQVKGEGEKTEVMVAFENKGVKKLMLSFAPIEII